MSVAARYTASATSDSVVTTVAPTMPPMTRSANGAYASGISPSRRAPVLAVKRVVGP